MAKNTGKSNGKTQINESTSINTPTTAGSPTNGLLGSKPDQSAEELNLSAKELAEKTRMESMVAAARAMQESQFASMLSALGITDVDKIATLRASLQPNFDADIEKIESTFGDLVAKIKTARARNSTPMAPLAAWLSRMVVESGGYTYHLPEDQPRTSRNPKDGDLIVVSRMLRGSSGISGGINVALHVVEQGKPGFVGEKLGEFNVPVTTESTKAQSGTGKSAYHEATNVFDGEKTPVSFTFDYAGATRTLKFSGSVRSVTATLVMEKIVSGMMVESGFVGYAENPVGFGDNRQMKAKKGEAGKKPATQTAPAIQSAEDTLIAEATGDEQLAEVTA